MVNPEGQTGRDGGDAEEVTQVSHQSADSALCLISSNQRCVGFFQSENSIEFIQEYRNGGLTKSF